jgi:hypothetical protein
MYSVKDWAPGEQTGAGRHHIPQQRHIETHYEIIATRWLPPGCQKAQLVSFGQTKRGWYWVEALTGETWYNIIAQECEGRDYSRFEVSNLGRMRTASATETLDPSTPGSLDVQRRKCTV